MFYGIIGDIIQPLKFLHFEKNQPARSIGTQKPNRIISVKEAGCCNDLIELKERKKSTGSMLFKDILMEGYHFCQLMRVLRKKN